MNKCKYSRAYSYDLCGAEADESLICVKHKKEKCCVCSNQATNECNYTGQFVCGARLCDNCEEGADGDSTKGLGWGFIGHTHVPRARETLKGEAK